MIRVLYNNAGVFHPETDWLDVPPHQYDDTMAANVRVPFFASQWVARRLIAAGQGGSIVTTASMAGINGSTVPEYGASKAAVINLIKSLGQAGTRKRRRQPNQEAGVERLHPPESLHNPIGVTHVPGRTLSGPPISALLPR